MSRFSAAKTLDDMPEAFVSSAAIGGEVSRAVQGKIRNRCTRSERGSAATRTPEGLRKIMGGAALDAVRKNPYIGRGSRRTGMAAIIEETSTITAKGQTTVPKAVRRALGVDCGGKIAYRVERGRVTLHNPQAEHRDPALAAFLRLIETDVAAGRNLRGLPAGIAAAMHRAMKEVRVDLDEKPEDEVAL